MTSEFVFVSYTRDSPHYIQAVRDLVRGLRAAGVDARSDNDVDAPPEGWVRWMHFHIVEARHVLIVCSAAYARRLAGREEGGVGLGATFESFIILNELYDSGMKSDKYVPVLVNAQDKVHIDVALRGYRYYDLSSPTDLADLFARLNARPNGGMEPLAPPDCSTEGPATHLRLFPVHGVIDPCEIPSELVKAYAVFADTPAKVRDVLSRAWDLRKETMEPNEHKFFPESIDLPAAAQVEKSATEYWWSAFTEFRLSGPRTMAALLLALDDSKLNDKAQFGRETLLRRLFQTENRRAKE